MRRTAAAMVFSTFVATPVFAEGFQRIDDKNDFLKVVAERDLTRFAIRLRVTETGDIVGRAFGQDVSGDWAWRDGYFCRSLFWGSQNIGDNCQTVELRGETIRFTSDRGAGQYADLKID